MVETTLQFKEMEAVLKRFNKKDLITVIVKLFPDVISQLPEDFASFTKRSIVSSIYEKLVQEENKDIITFRLELHFILTYSNKKIWHIYKLINVKEGYDDMNFFDPESFMESLEENLSRSKFHSKVYSEFHQEAIWTEVTLQPIASQMRKQKFFLVHYPHLPYVLHSSVPKSLLDLLKLSLQLTFKCRKVKSLKLNSKNMGTVLQLALQKDGQKFNGGPMPAILQVLHKPVAGVETLESPNVIDEEKTLTSNNAYMMKMYGKYQQPPLESLSVEMESSLVGDDGGHIAKCKVTFSGSNVLEGIRDTVQQNFIQQPLYDALEKLPHLGRNRIKLIES